MERLAAKKRKGVLGTLGKDRRFSSTAPRSAGVGGYGTPAHIKELETGKDAADTATPVSETKATPVSEPKATTAEERADLEKKYGSFEGAKRAIAAEGARYREALQPKKGFEEDYDADVKFQEEEYGGGSIRREMELDEIRGEADPETGVREAALGEDAAEYDKQYAKLEKENPNMSETELQDAAIKAVRSLQARDAEFAAKDFKTVDYGDEMENEVRRKRLEAEAAEKERKERQKSMVKKAIGTGKLKGDRITKTPDGTPIQEAARKYIESSYGPDKEASESKLARMRETADARRRNLPVDVGESESSGDLEFEPEESEVTEQEVEDAAIEREYEARPTQSGASRVAPQSQEEKEEYARYKPEVKQVTEARIVKPATEALDNIYLTPDNQESTAENLDKFLTKTRLGYSVLGEAGQSALDSLTARNDYQYYKTLPLFMKRNLDKEALKAIEFFDEFNRKRGQPTVGKGFFDQLLSPDQKTSRRYKFLGRIARARRALEKRLETNDYEQSENLPGRFLEGDYLPFADYGPSAYSEDVPLEAQEDVYQESEMEDLIASAAGE